MPANAESANATARDCKETILLELTAEEVFMLIASIDFYSYIALQDPAQNQRTAKYLLLAARIDFESQKLADRLDEVDAVLAMFPSPARPQ